MPEPDRNAALRRWPAMMVGGNGTELMSDAMLRAEQHRGGDQQAHMLTVISETKLPFRRLYVLSNKDDGLA